jgi:hypothetical protein
MWKQVLCCGLLLVLGAGCSTDPAPNTGGGPRLIQDLAIDPTESEGAIPILGSTMTAPPTETPPRQITSEVVSPLQQTTVEADFVLVTPTLPPSKTPTTTPTITATPSQSPTPTITVTATATAPAFPTSVIIPVTAPVVQPQPVVCDSTWFFIEPRPANCPAAPPTASQGVYQSFENGYMVWVGALDAIYVMYSDTTFPRWEVWRDEFNEGEMEEDPSWPSAPDGDFWQPRRGFGELWRREDAVRDRIGWATLEMEEPYNVRVQNDNSGTLFIEDPEGGIFTLLPNSVDWQYYTGTTEDFANFNSTSTPNYGDILNP